MPAVRRGAMIAMRHRDRVALGIAGACVLVITVIEQLSPANVVAAYGYVLPILLVTTLRNRTVMLVTVLVCVAGTYSGLLQPTKPGRFQSAVINRSVVVGVLLLVAYLGMSWEERKAREEAARAALAKETENLLKANAQLVQAKDQLNRSERLAAVGQLVASVAHEVGTPLHSIAWHVQALGEEPGATPEMKKRIVIIDEQLTRVVRIIQDLLSSTRQRRPDPQWCAVEEVVNPAAALMEPAYHAKGITLTVPIPEDWPLVWADQEKIHQALVNILANALVATPPGGSVNISVTARGATAAEQECGASVADPAPQLVLTIAIQDTGCGVPEADAEKAFEPFFTTKVVGKGTGLGLFLSRETVVAHGGSLGLVSEVGRGTTVTLTLPAKRTDAAYPMEGT
jgi:two-component system, NtrC family, sensor kinase